MDDFWGSISSGTEGSREREKTFLSVKEVFWPLMVILLSVYLFSFT